MGNLRKLALTAVAASLCFSISGCSQSGSSQESGGEDYSVDNSVNVVYPDGSQETISVDVYVPEKNPLTESEKGTISLFTDKFSSWGQFWSCGDPSFGLNGMSKNDDPSFQDNTTAMINSEVSRPEIVVADDDFATVVIASKGNVNSGHYPGFVVAVKNNSDDRIVVNSQNGQGTAKGNTAITTLNGEEINGSLAFSVNPGYWSYGSLTFGDADYDEFANGTVEGCICVTGKNGKSEETRTYYYEA